LDSCFGDPADEGALQIRSDLSKEDALKLIDNLRWLAEQSYDR
jgi:hypothetical protein